MQRAFLTSMTVKVTLAHGEVRTGTPKSSQLSDAPELYRYYNGDG